ncbi:MAG: tryptophan synthase subunit alpha [bacterium]|nr:tryptophan synthase subunit alpha [bacterium]
MNVNRIERALHALQESEHAGIAPYVTAGDGGFETTKAVLLALEAGGATCVELGVPFSDPIADGPVLQAAAERSLRAGTTLTKILAMVRDLRRTGCVLPIALFSYANPLYSMGWRNAAKASREAGVDGWLVPDIVPFQGVDMQCHAEAEGLVCVHFAAPTSSPERIASAAQASRGFLYAIGRLGVTGGNTSLDANTLDFLRSLRAKTTMPIGVGFGLRTAEQVTAVTQHAELAIVGSAFVERLRARFDKTQSPGAVAEEAHSYLSELSQGLLP